MNSSLGFGSIAYYYIVALFRLAFATAPFLLNLTLQYTITRWLIMQKVRGHTYVCRASTACKQLVSGLFHSPPGVLFTFPSRYLSTIGC